MLVWRVVFFLVVYFCLGVFMVECDSEILMVKLIIDYGVCWLGGLSVEKDYDGKF